MIFGGYDFYNYAFNTIETAFFPNKNVIRVLEMLFFALLISMRIKNAETAKGAIKMVGLGVVFAMVWGAVQFIIKSAGLEYPHWLFNNAIVFAQFYYQISPTGLFRINSIAIEPSVYGMMLNTFLPIAITFAVYYKWSRPSKLKTFLQYLLAIFAVSSAIITTSSTAYLGIVSATIFIICYLLFFARRDGKLFKSRFKTIAKLIGIVVFGYCLASASYDIMPRLFGNDGASSIEATMLDATAGKANTESGFQRKGGMITGMTLFMNHPLFGNGYGTYRSFDVVSGLLCNAGIVGLSLYIMIFIVVFESFRKVRYTNEKLFIALLGSLIEIAVSGISVPDLVEQYIWIIFATMFALGKFAKSQPQTIKKKNIKRIGIDVRSLKSNRSGIGTYVYEVLKKLNDEDDKNEYYLYSDHDPIIDFEMKPNFKIIKVSSKFGTIGFYYFKMTKLLYRDNIDVFFGPNFWLPERNSYTEDIKYVVTIHDLAIKKIKGIGKLRAYVMVQFFSKKACQNADKIITVSEATARVLHEIYKIPNEKIKTIYIAGGSTYEKITKNEESEIRKKFGIKNNKFIMFLSTIEPRKNLSTLVSAFEQYKSCNKDDLKLVIAGGYGWRSEDTMEQIHNSKYFSDIILTGYVNEKEKTFLYRNAEGFFYPSLYEGFGIPVLEAMKNKTLVVSANNSSLPEVGGKAAIYFDNAKDVDGLSKMIEKVINIPSKEKTKYIEAGLKQSEKFSWEKCAKETRKVLDEK